MDIEQVNSTKTWARRHPFPLRHWIQAYYEDWSIVDSCLSHWYGLFLFIHSSHPLQLFTLNVFYLIEIIFNQVYSSLLRLLLPFSYGLNQVFYCS